MQHSTRFQNYINLRQVHVRLRGRADDFQQKGRSQVAAPYRANGTSALLES